jgi:hypothetical protein
MATQVRWFAVSATTGPHSSSSATSATDHPWSWPRWAMFHSCCQPCAAVTPARRNLPPESAFHRQLSCASLYDAMMGRLLALEASVGHVVRAVCMLTASRRLTPLSVLSANRKTDRKRKNAIMQIPSVNYASRA